MQGYSPLFVAATMGFESTVRALLRACAGGAAVSKPAAGSSNTDPESSSSSSGDGTSQHARALAGLDVDLHGCRCRNRTGVRAADMRLARNIQTTAAAALAAAAAAAAGPGKAQAVAAAVSAKRAAAAAGTGLVLAPAAPGASPLSSASDIHGDSDRGQQNESACGECHGDCAALTPTPLWEAVCDGNDAIAAMLLGARADVTFTMPDDDSADDGGDGDGGGEGEGDAGAKPRRPRRSMVSVATERGHTEVVALLEAAANGRWPEPVAPLRGEWDEERDG